MRPGSAEVLAIARRSQCGIQMSSDWTLLYTMHVCSVLFCQRAHDAVRACAHARVRSKKSANSTSTLRDWLSGQVAHGFHPGVVLCLDR